MNSTPYHLITCEYPPQVGGVSDYTHLVATELAASGEEVHVWCPGRNGHSNGAVDHDDSSGVVVHREFGGFKPADLSKVGNLLGEFSGPRRLLIQWVPHGYGYRSMNLPFCLWLRRRALRHRDRVEVMVHEPYLAFGEGSWKQNGVAAVHRLMTMVLLDAAQRVWVSIPAWERRWRPYALRRELPFHWLPVASNIAVVDDPIGVEAVRSRYVPNGEQIVGHFGTYDRHISSLLLRSVPQLLRYRSDCMMLLLGRGGEAARDELLRRHPELVGQIHATGGLGAADLSRHISACDVLLQPYVDGVSARRTSVMVGLSHGVPIVTTNGRLTEPLWSETDAVALAPAGDILELVDAANQVLTQTQRLCRMKIAAKVLYLERFDIKRTIRALRELAI